jgi:hypothetical protein
MLVVCVWQDEATQHRMNYLERQIMEIRSERDRLYLSLDSAKTDGQHELQVQLTFCFPCAPPILAIMCLIALMMITLAGMSRSIGAGSGRPCAISASTAATRLTRICWGPRSRIVVESNPTGNSVSSAHVTRITVSILDGRTVLLMFGRTGCSQICVGCVASRIEIQRIATQRCPG